MFVSGRSCYGPAAWLLGSALAAAFVTEELNCSHVLATCLSKGQASVVASSAWKYFTCVNLTRSTTVMCQLNVSIVPRDDLLATHSNPQTSLVTPSLRLLFRIDRWQLKERKLNASECQSAVTLRHLTARSDTLCSNSADRYAWLDEWLTVIISPNSERSIIHLDVSFVALLAINVCEGDKIGTATLEVDNITYAYAPDAWYGELLQHDSKCRPDRNYTVLARASDTSRLLQVSVLAVPAIEDAGCRRLCVENRCFVTGDADASVESAAHVKIVYAAVGRCPGVRQTGFTVKLESILSPELRSSSADGTIAVVASLVAVTLIGIVMVVTVITVRRRRLRGGGRGYPLSVPPSEVVACSRTNEYTSVPLTCPDEADMAAASLVLAEREIAMVDNDLYA